MLVRKDSRVLYCAVACRVLVLD